MEVSTQISKEYMADQASCDMVKIPAAAPDQMHKAMLKLKNQWSKLSDKENFM
jgi:hypothetical protein